MWNGLRRGVLAMVMAASGLGVFSSAIAAEVKPPPSFPFFVLDNGVGRGEWSARRQAEAIHALDVDGMSYNDVNRPEAVAEWQRELHARGLKLFALYVHSFPDRTGAARFPSKLRETIHQLRGSETAIWLTLRETADHKKTGHDAECVATITEVAHWCREAGIPLVIYPHNGFYVGTAEEALRVLAGVADADVGVTLNLCHELMQGNEARLSEIVREAGSRLALVTINGADRRGEPGGFILRLDQGSFNVREFLQTLQASGYRGPVGLQCYSVPGDVQENLEKSVAAWRGLTGP